MIEDARVLREEFVPNDVVHRDGEVDALSAVLEPVVEGQPPESALLTGPSGAGKTTIAKFVVGRLRETALDVESIHVNCWQSYTRFKALYRILEGLGRTIDVHRQSTPHDELLDRLEAYDGPPVIVTLDEVDQLEDGHLIYDLYRLPAFAVVLITNDEEELLAGLDERVRSRLHTAQTIHFDRYDVDELTDIMADRVDHGLSADAVDFDQLRWIADAAAGDARVGLSILRSAARRADRDGADAIAASHIEAAIPEARQEVRSRALDALHKEQRKVFEILQKSDGLPPREVYDRYVAAVTDPRTKRTVRSWLQKLEQYNLVEADGSGPTRTYRVIAEE
ncbi:Cdc6/Cdc18 family protein [Halorhabdus sp. BNX81]|uniref:Cdc6/Cdc18 family protein n=1 Tax=Halorhabdus sp. BNX81 TaxID=2980181 RepID=UPI0023DD1C94|nr:Cdc6/Cdc18 family protein [Halorhabdus sp. BNX81]WEL22632.1 Cdc6-related protein, AAA superfamily ATPase [Halorhabdus sp. BNX81]